MLGNEDINDDSEIGDDSPLALMVKDQFGNYGPDVHIVGPTYANGLSAPVGTVTKINNGVDGIGVEWKGEDRRGTVLY